MTKEQKFRKEIEIAFERGFCGGVPGYSVDEFIAEMPGPVGCYAIAGVFFSHDFFKAYFGGDRESKREWCLRVVELFLSEDRIEYLWEHRPK